MSDAPGTPSSASARTPSGQAAAAGSARPGGRPAFVATTGGHLVQLTHLARLLEPARHEQGLWITHRTPQSESMMAGRDVRFVPFVHARRVHEVLLGTPRLLAMLRREGVDTVYSTGAAVSLAALPLAPLVRTRPVFVESLARADGPSMAGKVHQRLPWVQRYTQYPANAGPRWRHEFSLLDTFALAEPVPTTPRRVLVSVGTARPWGFERMLRRVLEVLPPGADVLWQTGVTSTAGLELPGTVVASMSDEEFRTEIDRADVVVSHAGVGTFVRCLEAGKAPVLVPRRAAHGEHVDDHQLQIAGVAAARGLAVVREADELAPDDLLAAAALRVVPA
ncbi:glycosyltransferase [Aquipuribacter hungaricus]|uniref:Glycosyltransferase n=1 Tax=Aquipuribacter hungaricus TaxID=545624 RepID=A0ABV7WDC8_9MICO